MTVSSKLLFGVNDGVLVKVLAHLTTTPTRSLIALLSNKSILMRKISGSGRLFNEVLTVSVGLEPLSSEKHLEVWLGTQRLAFEWAEVFTFWIS